MPLEKSDFEALARRLAVHWKVSLLPNGIGIVFSAERVRPLTICAQGGDNNATAEHYLIGSLREAGIEFQINVEAGGFDVHSKDTNDASDIAFGPVCPTLSEALIRFINSLSITLPVPTS